MKKHQKYDVVVLGGGVAGLAAAIASAKSGAHTALVERNSYLGGKATSAYVGTVCGAFFRSLKNAEKLVAGGILKEIIGRIKALSNAKVHEYGEGLRFLDYDNFIFKKVCDALIEESNVDLFLQATVHSARLHEESKKIASVELLAYDENIKFNASVFVDCTGDALLVNLLNLKSITSDVYQASAQVFGLNGVQHADFQILKLSMLKSISRGIAEERLSADAKRVSIVPASFRNDGIFLKMGIPRVVNSDFNRMTEINIKARQLIFEVYSYLKNNNTYFEKTTLPAAANEVGIRTGRRHLGKYLLTREDVLQMKKSKQSIARGAWPIEHWSLDAKPKMEYFDLDEYFDIPADALCSNQLSNLYFGGRNISADDDAIASARVIGTCIQTGFAAGKLAYAHCKIIPKEEIIPQIQKELNI